MTLEELQDNIGIRFTNSALLTQAFYHRSYLNEARHIKESNERLEFLGDAILSFLCSQFLYTTYPSYPEGILTNIRSAIVNTKSLATEAGKLKFGDLLFLSRGEEESGGRTNTSLLADCFESFIGALYLDKDIEAVEKFLKHHLFYKTSDIVENKLYLDFKSFLQEIVQETSKISPTYTVTKSEGPDHDKTFWMEARIGTVVLGSGKGKSKQEAEQEAARSSLEKMRKL